MRWTRLCHVQASRFLPLLLANFLRHFARQREWRAIEALRIIVEA